MSGEPLFVQYDKRLDTIRKLLFCIHSALPNTIRKNLKSASIEWRNAKDSSIIFSEMAYRKKYYFDPVTGEKNI